MRITILGNGAGGYFQGHWYTAQVLEYGSARLLLDCGEGTQMRLYELGFGQPNFSAVFITHLHGDHVLGLIGLLNSWSMMGREKPLPIFGPSGLRALLDLNAEIGTGFYGFPLEVTEVDTEIHQTVWETKNLEVLTLPLSHHVPTCGYLIREKPKLRNIRPDKITQFALDHAAIRAVKAGADFVTTDGTTVPNAELTLDPPPLLSYAYCTDTVYHPPLPAQIQGVTCLFHEATFTRTYRTNAAAGMHSTAHDAASIARRARAGHLLLGHISSRFETPDELLTEARAVFQDTDMAEAGTTYEISGFLKQTADEHEP